MVEGHSTHPTSEQFCPPCGHQNARNLSHCPFLSVSAVYPLLGHPVGLHNSIFMRGFGTSAAVHLGKTLSLATALLPLWPICGPAPPLRLLVAPLAQQSAPWGMLFAGAMWHSAPVQPIPPPDFSGHRAFCGSPTVESLDGILISCEALFDEGISVVLLQMPGCCCFFS